MRVIIAYEDKSTLLHQYLLPGALHFHDETLPVCISSDKEEFAGWEPVGTATDFRREKDGAVTAEVDEAIIPEDYSATIFCDNLVGVREKKDGRDVYVVASARVRMIYLTKSVPWRTYYPGEHK